MPNIFCCASCAGTYDDLVPFSAIQINDLFVWFVGIHLYHNKAHVEHSYFQGSNLIGFQGSKIIVGMILQPTTASPGKDSRL